MINELEFKYEKEVDDKEKSNIENKKNRSMLPNRIVKLVAAQKRIIYKRFDPILWIDNLKI